MRSCYRRPDRLSVAGDWPISALARRKITSRVKPKWMANIRPQQATIAGIVQRLRRFGISGDNGRTTFLTPLRAPFAGVVTKAEGSPGDVVDAGKDIFTVVDLSRVWVQAKYMRKTLAESASARAQSFP